MYAVMKNEGLNKIAVQISCDLSNVIIYSKNEGETITIKKHYHWCDVSLIEHIESNNCGLMVFSDTITKLNDGAFSYTALTSITVPAASACRAIRVILSGKENKDDID